MSGNRQISFSAPGWCDSLDGLLHEWRRARFGSSAYGPHAIGRHLFERQLTLSLVKPREGPPIANDVHPGNVAEVTSLLPTVRRLVARHAVTRVVLVADCGLLSLDNLEQLCQITLPSGTPLEFVLAVPYRK